MPYNVPPPPYSESAPKPMPGHAMQTPYGPVEPNVEKMRPAEGEFLISAKNPYASPKQYAGPQPNPSYPMALPNTKSPYPNNSPLGSGSAYSQGPPSAYPPNVGGGTSNAYPGGRISPYSANVGGGTSSSGPYAQPYTPSVGSGATSAGPYPGGRVSPYSVNIGSGTTAYPPLPNNPSIGSGSYQSYSSNPPPRMPSPGPIGSGGGYQAPYNPSIGGGANQGYQNLHTQMPLPGQPMVGSGATSVGFNQGSYPRPHYDQPAMRSGSPQNYPGIRSNGPGFANDHVGPLAGRMNQMNIGGPMNTHSSSSPYFPGNSSSGGYYGGPRGVYPSSSSGHVGTGGSYYSPSHSPMGYTGGSCNTGGYCSKTKKKYRKKKHSSSSSSSSSSTDSSISGHHSHHHHHC